MAKFRVGDAVRVRPDLKDQEIYKMDSGIGAYLAVGSMLQYSDLETTVAAIDTNESFYKLEIDGHQWKWTDEMLVYAQESNDQFGTDEEFYAFLGDFYAVS